MTWERGKIRWAGPRHLGSNLWHRSVTLIKSLLNFSVRLTTFISADLWYITVFPFLKKKKKLIYCRFFF